MHDRSIITTSHAETRAVTPAGLQDAIDACVGEQAAPLCHVCIRAAAGALYSRLCFDRRRGRPCLRSVGAGDAA